MENHVVVAIICRRKTDDDLEYLLIKAKKDFGDFTGCWYPPGGHLEKGESEQAALIREIQEELSLTIEPLRKIAETPGDVKGQVTHWWECMITSGKMQVDPGEIADAGWFTKAQMNTMRLWPATKNFFYNYII